MNPTSPACRDKILARRALWDWHDDSRIDILDREGRVKATLDLWQTALFHEADGFRTVGRFLAWARGRHKDPADLPPDLDEQIGAALRFLVEELGAVELCDRPEELPHHFALPRSEQDRETALRTLRKDGLTGES